MVSLFVEGGGTGKDLRGECRANPIWRLVSHG